MSRYVCSQRCSSCYPQGFLLIGGIRFLTSQDQPDEIIKRSRTVSSYLHAFMKTCAPNKQPLYFHDSGHEVLIRHAKIKVPSDRNERESLTKSPRAFDKVHLKKHYQENKAPEIFLLSPMDPARSEFPSTRKLKLEMCSWHIPADVKSTWNFTDLRSLSLKNSNLISFLIAMPLLEFPQLRTLKISQDLDYSHYHPRGSSLQLFLESCPELETLKIECGEYSGIILWTDIYRLGTRLRRLRLLNLCPNSPQTPGLLQLSELFHACPNIEDLGFSFFDLTRERDEVSPKYRLHIVVWLT